MDFLLVQFGLSVFTYNSETNKYSQRSYNFYVFPRPFDRSAPDCRFLCQAACIDFLVNQGFDFNKLYFLVNQGFDFNKLFKYGIPYLKKDDENWLNKKFDEKQKIRDNYDLISISDDDRPQIEEICSRIKDFINLEDKEIIIDRCNSFIRRLIYQEVKLRWPNKFGLKTMNDNQSNQCIVVYKIGTKEEEEQREIERREKQKLEVQEAVGLSALLKKIANSGKLIVGHNMLLDLCHIINQFFDSLPESYLKFKSLVHCLFPRLLDTKIICQSAQFKDSVPSVLHQLLETLHNSPFELPETEDVSDRSYKISNNKSHEAGYDAFITGLCFIALSNRLGSLQRPQVSTVLADSQLLNPFLNKLLITRLKDYPYINLTGKDPNPSRDHVFHITFPKEWKYSDLSQLFTPYGGAFVSWLTDKSAYVALYRRDQISAVMNDLVKPHNKHYSIKKYREHHANLEREHQVKPERKRKISDCESPTKIESSPPPTTTGSKSTTLNTDEDGWEVASGKRRRKRNRIQTNVETEVQNKSDDNQKAFAENETWR
ncbi:PREDICTED: poly(A)-specific ribonuclease PARN-like [Ceratosolen solmsi marchali]|uniref:Poly(A)-specific ribonuclease PARN-like n=1 Tax=Ceratosolen solmsi marchali TaxID=326594 RepID=A0AAJ7DVF6_9HYME|nr:PREDICTED: poly(A)-specific ribonuclease PARN-like [Ceratosolen solmsi marchali]